MYPPPKMSQAVAFGVLLKTEGLFNMSRCIEQPFLTDDVPSTHPRVAQPHNEETPKPHTRGGH